MLSICERHRLLLLLLLLLLLRSEVRSFQRGSRL
jgi:hypothetical protein